jgi:hypothetical protein
MTIGLEPVARRAGWRPVIIAIIGGLLLGVADLAAQRVLPYPWANLANSSAVWAVGALGAGALAASGGVRDGDGARRSRSALAGLIVLLTAVESYYVAAALWLEDAWSNLWQPGTLVWLLFAAITGPVFGAAGGWSRSDDTRKRMIGTAVAGAVLFAEAGVLVYRSGSGDAAYRTDSLQTAAIEAAAGLLLVLIAGRTWRQRLGAVASSVPLTAIGFGLFLVAGFGR